MNDKKGFELNEQELDSVSGGAIPSQTRDMLVQLLDVEKNETTKFSDLSFTKEDGTTVTVTATDGGFITIKGT